MSRSRVAHYLPYVPAWDRELVGAVGVVVVSGYGVIGIEQDAVNGARQKATVRRDQHSVICQEHSRIRESLRRYVYVSKQPPCSADRIVGTSLQNEEFPILDRGWS